jgi:hypothetical protein
MFSLSRNSQKPSESKSANDLISATIATTIDNEPDYLLVSAEEDDQFVFVQPHAQANVFGEKTLAQKIKRASQLHIQYRPTNVHQQLLRYIIVVPGAILDYFKILDAGVSRSHQDIAIQDVIHSASLEFPLLGQIALQLLKVNEDILLNKYYTQLKVNEKLAKQMIVRIENAMKSNTLFDLNDLRDLRQKLARTIVTQKNRDELFRRLMQLSGDGISDQAKLTAGLLKLTRINYSSLTLEETETYHAGIRKLKARHDRVNAIFSKRFTSQTPILPNGDSSSLIAIGYLYAMYFIIKNPLIASGLPHVPLLMTMAGLLMGHFARFDSYFADVHLSKNDFILKRFEENLFLNDFNKPLPAFLQYHQRQNTPQHHPQPGMSLFKRGLTNTVSFLQYDKYLHSSLMLFMGVIINLAFSEIKNAGLNDSMTDRAISVALHVACLCFMAHTTTGTRTLENALLSSEERYQKWQRAVEVEMIWNFPEKLFHSAQNLNHFWQKPRTTPLQIEVLADPAAAENKPVSRRP